VSEPPSLRRSLNLPLLVLYGLGTTVGAGIYALLGEVANRSGMYAPVSFAVAAGMAAATAFSFAELSSRFPRSAGEAVYVREGLGTRVLPIAVGVLVVLSGSVSSATIANGFVGYLGELVEVPREVAILGLLLALGGIAAWGIRASVVTAAVVTLLEVAGLLAVLWVCRDGFSTLPERWVELVPGFELGAWQGIFAASFLAFYAFLGFEDMVNVAEEVRDAPRTLPVAIIATLLLTTVLYMGIATAAVLSLPPQDLARSAAPLATLWQRATGGSGALIGSIGVLAMLNGALIQLIMASRVLYGLADQGELPRSLARIHPRTRTPVIATAAVTVVVCALAIGFRLAFLAGITSLLTLMVFALVNLSLWRVKLRDPDPGAGVRTYPIWVPVTGFVVSAGFLAIEASRQLFGG